MSIPLVDSLDEALGRLFPAKVMNDLFSVENLRGEMQRGGVGKGSASRGKLRNGSVKKQSVELKGGWMVKGERGHLGR